MAMKKQSRARVSAPEDFPGFGAIFMANRATMEECLDRRLFGLPSSQQGFVRGVKAGMVLFLFEYEERLLYGVFRATSGGGFNIVPRAYGSRFPAQVRFSKIWDSNPLCEDVFRDAIRENYYQRFKFLFGLSYDQVYKLLLLFNSRRTEVSTVRSLSCEREWNKDPSRDTEAERKLSSGRSFVTCKQPESRPSDQIVKEMACGSLSLEESGVSISSFESESGPNDFGAGVGATISKEEPENTKDSSKTGPNDFGAGVGATISKEEPGNTKDSSTDIGGGLEDFIPLPSPDNSDNETEFPEKDQTESVALQQCFPIKLVSNEDSGKEGNRSPLQVGYSLRSNVSNNKEDLLRVKGLYSDDQENRSSVFSRLKFGSKDAGQENRKRTREDNLVRESRGDSQQRHGNEETTVVSRLSLNSKVMQDIIDALKLQNGGRHKKKMEETNFAPKDGEGYGDMRSLAYECKGQIKEEKIGGSESVQDIMDTLLQRHSALRKIDAGHKAFVQEDVERTVKKNVFSRLSQVPESFHWDTEVTMRLLNSNGMGIERVKSAGFCVQARNHYYSGNNFSERWPATLSWRKTRESEVPNQNYEAEENFEASAHISKMLKGETLIEEGEYVNDSESKHKSEQHHRRKLVRPLLNQWSEVKTRTLDSCLNVQILSDESSAYNENNERSEASAKRIIADEKMASLEKEVQNSSDPLNCKGDEGEADCNFISDESNSGELLVGGFNSVACTVTKPLKTYKRRAKKV